MKNIFPTTHAIASVMGIRGESIQEQRKKNYRNLLKENIYKT